MRWEASMSGTTFPTRGDQIDCAWLTSVLREEATLGPRCRPTSIFAAAAAAQGQGDWRESIFGRVNAATEDWKLADVWQAYAAEARAAQQR
jgi:hypothetical protein